MPFCPECKAEYVEGTEKCSDCDVPLVSAKEFAKIKKAEDRLREVIWSVAAATPYPAEAIAWKAALEEAEIEVVLFPEPGHAEMLPGTAAEQKYALQVPDDQLDQARRELERLREGVAESEGADEGAGTEQE